MKKLKILFKLSFKFCKKYFLQYFVLMLKPIVFIIIGFLSVLLALISPVFALVALLISIPCVCYGFWKGFVVTYSLNIAALQFMKNGSGLSLSECYKLALSKEKDFAKYVGFCALIYILGYLPTIIYFFHLIPLSDIVFVLNNPYDYIDKLFSLEFAVIANTIPLLPFLNFATQAYLFKKDESYIKLFLNCYSKLDVIGFFIALAANLVCFLSGIFYILTFVIINAIVYSINTFWYYSRVSKK